MNFDYGQTLPSFGPHYANKGLYFRRREVLEGDGDLFAGGSVQPGSHMLLINGLMDRQQSGVK